MTSKDKAIDRRLFLQGSALTAVSAGAVSGALASTTDKKSTEACCDPKKILNYNPQMKYRCLPGTDMQLSVITLGGYLMTEKVHHYGIDQGVNLVHIANNYIKGKAIRMVGNVLKTRRKDVYVALKDNFTDKGYDPAALDDVLKTLNTDYVDLLMFNRHSADDAGDEKIQGIFEKYKADGKVRYCGLTSHGNVKEATAAGIKSGMYCLVNPALNQPSFEALDADLKAAQKKNIGVMAMKTMKGIDGGIEMETAYFKKVLSNPAVTTVLRSFDTFENFDAYLKATNEALTSAEDRELYRYAQANRANNYMMCDECKGVCPDGVEISTVIRCKDYYHDQMGATQSARATYRAIPEGLRGSDACIDCSRCEKACPNGIPVVRKLAEARQTFA